MTEITQWLQANGAAVFLAMAGICALLLVLTVLLWQRTTRMRRKWETFTGSRVMPDISLGEVLSDYAARVETVSAETAGLLKRVGELEENMIYCSQKLGVVRYNPYEEAGGNLSFAVAILDGNDDGVVLNGIHSRTGTYVYAKPIEMGVSRYVLSAEELSALKKALAGAYNPPEPEAQQGPDRERAAQPEKPENNRQADPESGKEQND